jgi:hypothetical protein
MCALWTSRLIRYEVDLGNYRRDIQLYVFRFIR